MTFPSGFPWGLLTNPYALSAIACAVLAIAVSCLRSQEGKPSRDARRRIVANDLRRVSDSQFIFSSTSGPEILVDTQDSKIFALHPASSHQDVDLASDDADLVPTRVIGDAPYQVHHIADIQNARVLKKGLHFRKGRSVELSFSERNINLAFQTRAAAAAFLDLFVGLKRDSRPETVSLFLTTFNVGNSKPPDDLSPWLSQASSADIIAIGAQECSYSLSASSSEPSLQDSSSQAISFDESVAGSEISTESDITETTPLLDSDVARSSSFKSASSRPVTEQSSGVSSGKEHWHTLLLSHFPEDQYDCITRQTAWDRCLTIFVKKPLQHAVTDVRSDTANVGLAGVAGNKGAIGTRFSVFDTDFVIINSHLAAHHKEVARRNEDYSSISSSLHKLRDDQDVDLLSNAVHHTFWMGDLNYRIDLDRDHVLELIEERNWKELQEADQLLQERSAGRAFPGFLEGKTDFAPTYKYEHGSRKYSSTKSRIPSYCDRILYRSLAGCNVELHEYEPIDVITTSDHSPVYAKFTASLVHTTGTRSLDRIDVSSAAEELDTPQSPYSISPRGLSVRSLLPSRPIPTGAQLKFESLRATDIPEMDYGGKRIAVAKAFGIDTHMGWKKHEELGAGQHADPYCTFHGPAVAELDEGEYRTSTVTASQNPIWKPEELPQIALIGNEKDVLRKSYFIITVKDENPVRQDGIVGFAILRLENAVDGNGTRFVAPLMYGGLQRGELVGEYVVG